MIACIERAIGVAADPIGAGNQAEGLFEVLAEFVRGAGLAGIVAGDGET